MWKWFPVSISVGLIVGLTIYAARGEPAKASPDYQDGFCAGWNAAQSIEAQRAGNWRSLVLVGRSEEGAKTQVGQATDTLVNSVAAYVLIQPLQGQVTIDGRQIDCTPKAPAADPAKPAPIEEIKKP